ncbi:MAG: tRNA epoxyqueuosine(34) reductase QueG [Burkholderiaceae bacterium]|jgi:epoxyqueuosine reductase
MNHRSPSPLRRTTNLSEAELAGLVRDIKAWASELGFGRVGISDIQMSDAEEHLLAWLEKGFHGEMHYMARHGRTRARPAELVAGTVRVITAALDYVPDTNNGWVESGWRALSEPGRANVSVYARGRDYHKVVRQRLKDLAQRIAEAVGPYGYRVFSDSAPVLEVELARKAGLGWRGKHTLLLSSKAGSMFFLGEIFIDLPLPVDLPLVAEHCGTCARCIDVCPTGAIIGPYELDARRCISYLTIELAGSIPVELRALVGNRVYGCDDCQLVCPWNKYARSATVEEFRSRGFDELGLIEAFAWDEQEFLRRTEGTAIRRIGFERWSRNLAVALGNALREEKLASARVLYEVALRARLGDPSAVVREHVQWALAQDGRPHERGVRIPIAQGKAKAAS